MIFSSELPEIVNICDRMFILYDGVMKTEIKNGSGIDSEEIIHIATGGEIIC
jgi:ribose transport system ATP-binding protein